MNYRIQMTLREFIGTERFKHMPEELQELLTILNLDPSYFVVLTPCNVEVGYGDDEWRT